jgi:hypothetical protein
MMMAGWTESYYCSNTEQMNCCVLLNLLCTLLSETQRGCIVLKYFVVVSQYSARYEDSLMNELARV